MKIHAENNQEREKQIKQLHNFISEHKLAVISSATGNCLPQAGVVGFALTENLEIIFSTFLTSRKYVNLKKNPSVALVIGWEKGRTVQYEGLAKELSQEDAEEALKTTLANVPSIGKYIQREHRVLYKISPKWIRFTNLSVDPWDRFELKFK